MKKFKAFWIVLIVFCSLIVISGFFYLFYRLYIHHIYKRKRAWYDITTNESIKYIDENVNSILSRQSISPLIQEYLPVELRNKPMRRKMATQLQFKEAPLFLNNFNKEWDEMDEKSLLPLKSMSSQTSYYTIREETFCETSLDHYLSLTSANDLLQIQSSIEQISSNDNFSQQTSLQVFFKPCSNLSRRLLHHEKSLSNTNNSSEYIVINMDNINEINLFNNVSDV